MMQSKLLSGILSDWTISEIIVTPFSPLMGWITSLLMILHEPYLVVYLLSPNSNTFPVIEFLWLFINFASIPVRVTINEYIEIAKDYSTTKSSYFVNGVLDKISKEFVKNKRIVKIGRGLL